MHSIVMRTTLNPSRRYRNDILSWRAWELRLNYQQVARLTADRGRITVTGQTVKRVFNGEGATFDSVWAIADALKLDRHALTNFKLKEHQFRQALVTNGSGAVSGGRGRS